MNFHYNYYHFRHIRITSYNVCYTKLLRSDIIVSDSESYCEFGNTVTNVIDEIANYNKQEVGRIFYLNDGNLALVNENGVDIV